MRNVILFAGLLAVSAPASAQNRPVVQVTWGQSIEVPSNAICLGPQDMTFDPTARNGHWYCELPSR